MFYTGYNQSASKNVPLACYLLTDHMRWNSPNRYAYQAEMGGMARLCRPAAAGPSRCGRATGNARALARQAD